MTWRDSFTYFPETGLTYKGILCGTRIMLVWALQPLKTTTQTTSYLDGQRHPETSIPQLKDSFVCASKLKHLNLFGPWTVPLSLVFPHVSVIELISPNRLLIHHQTTKTQEHKNTFHYTILIVLWKYWGGAYHIELYVKVVEEVYIIYMS